MTAYNKIRESYKPSHVKYLLIAESPPPPAEVQSSRQFYYADRIRREDRLFTNTIKALYPEETDGKTEAELQQDKEKWLTRFQADGWYMIEALEDSQEHEVTKKDRQSRIEKALPKLIARVSALANKDTKIILIKSNVFVVAAEPLRQAGFTVLNTELLDYPGRFNQAAYREKLAKYVKR